MELHSYMKDGMIENWDYLEKVLDYAYEKVSFNILIKKVSTTRVSS